MNTHFPKDKRLSNLLCQKIQNLFFAHQSPKKKEKKLEFHQENVVSGEKNNPS